MATASPREQLEHAKQTTKQQASAALTDQKDMAAGNLGSLAGALRKAARESDNGGDTGATRMADWAADGLERVSNTLRNKDLDGMLRDVQSFARTQPVTFFVAAAALGFLATRFLKAGAGEQQAEFPEPGNFPMTRP